MQRRIIIGTITLGLIDIGSAVAGYLFGKIAPKVVTACAGDPTHDKTEVTSVVAKIEAGLAKIKSAL